MDDTVPDKLTERVHNLNVKPGERRCLYFIGSITTLFAIILLIMFAVYIDSITAWVNAPLDYNEKNIRSMLVFQPGLWMTSCMILMVAAMVYILSDTTSRADHVRTRWFWWSLAPGVVLGRAFEFVLGSDIDTGMKIWCAVVFPVVCGLAVSSMLLGFADFFFPNFTKAYIYKPASTKPSEDVVA